MAKFEPILGYEFKVVTDSFERDRALHNAYIWYHETPEFLRSYTKSYKSQEEFNNDIGNSMLFMGLIDGELHGVVHGEEKTENTVEGHLFCKKNSEIGFIISLVSFARRAALGKYDKVITNILSKHKTLHEVMRYSGFIDTGIRSWPTVYKDRLMESVFYISGDKA